MAQQDASYIGKGRLFIGPYAGGSAAVELGNCSALTLAVQSEEKSQLNYQVAGGGKSNRLLRITGVSVDITLQDITAENLAKALYALTPTAVTATTVTDETHTGYTGGFIKTDFQIDTTAAVGVTGTAGTPTFTEGTHFEKTSGGIVILAAPGGWTSGSAVLIDYTKKAGKSVQALTQSAQEYKLYFVGLNEAQSGRPATVVVHRFKPGPLEEFGLIGDDFASLKLAGEALADSTIVTAGASQYFATELAN